MESDLLSVFEPLSPSRSYGNANHTRSSIAATVFHPHKMVMAAAGVGDTLVSLWSCEKAEKALRVERQREAERAQFHG